MCINTVIVWETKCPNQNTPCWWQFQGHMLPVIVPMQLQTRKGTSPLEEQPFGVYNIHMYHIVLSYVWQRRRKKEDELAISGCCLVKTLGGLSRQWKSQLWTTPSPGIQLQTWITKIKNFTFEKLLVTAIGVNTNWRPFCDGCHIIFCNIAFAKEY